jgi:hypothetical protein
MKKNPLNDLDQFLQQEASSIVTPSSLSDKLKQETTGEPQPSQSHSSTESQLLALAQQNPEQFYDALISVGENMGEQKNTMLINTALYLKHGSEWKKAVEEYWSR